MLNLKTFAVNGALSYDDLDGNFTAIQNAFNNSALVPVNLYKLNSFTAANTCEPDGSNNLKLNGNIQFLDSSSVFPRLQLIVTLNTTIVKVVDLSTYFTGNNYPFNTGDQGGDIDLTVNIPANAYPASVVVYLFDQYGNFALPASVVIQDNPCQAPAEVLTLTTANIGAGPLAITGSIANGSNDYAVQYDNAGVWTNIGAWTQVDGDITQSFATAIKGTYNVRFIDTLTNNFSNVLSVTF